MLAKKSLLNAALSLAIVPLTLSLVATHAMASGPGERTLYSFKGGTTQGSFPFEVDGLVADTSGNLYGTASGGGPADNGAVVEFSPPTTQGGRWTETVIYAFQTGTDGNGPRGGLVFDQAGNLYGTTLNGGTARNGTVFELSPPTVTGDPWTETILYSFQGGTSDGTTPLAGAVFGSNGNLYGMTMIGGSDDDGVVYELSPPAISGQPWTETIITTLLTGVAISPAFIPMQALCSR